MSKGVPKGLWIGAGVLGAGVVLWASSSGGQKTLESAAESVEDGMDWLWRVIGRVSQHEGQYDSVNRNADGAGLSFGILQWVQSRGTLGVLLQAMYETDSERFAYTFGSDWQALLQATAAGSLDPVGGAVLWEEPWVSRFIAAGRDPVFIEVQKRMAAGGEHMKGALEAARLLGVTTERSVALMYDTSVQQGPGFAKKLAARVRGMFDGQTVPVKQVLRTYAELAPAHFKRTEAPTKPYPSEHIAWRQVGASEWHAYAGKFDLYTNILKRRVGGAEWYPPGSVCNWLIVGVVFMPQNSPISFQ